MNLRKLDDDDSRSGMAIGGFRNSVEYDVSVAGASRKYLYYWDSEWEFSDPMYGGIQYWIEEQPGTDGNYVQTNNFRCQTN